MTISTRLSPLLVHVSDKSVASSSPCRNHSLQTTDTDCGSKINFNTSSVSFESKYVSTEGTNDRKVRFSLTDNTPVKEYFIEASHTISERMISECWWSRKELHSNGLDRKRVVRQFLEKLIKEEEAGETTQDERGFCAVYKNCSTLSFSQVMRSKTTKDLFASFAQIDGLRGLEPKLFPRRQRRKYHLHAVISNQTDGASQECVSAASERSSHASRVLARVLAQLDMREAL